MRAVRNSLLFESDVSMGMPNSDDVNHCVLCAVFQKSFLAEICPFPPPNAVAVVIDARNQAHNGANSSR